MLIYFFACIHLNVIALSPAFEYIDHRCKRNNEYLSKQNWRKRRSRKRKRERERGKLSEANEQAGKSTTSGGQKLAAKGKNKNDMKKNRMRTRTTTTMEWKWQQKARKGLCTATAAAYQSRYNLYDCHRVAHLCVLYEYVLIDTCCVRSRFAFVFASLSLPLAPSCALALLSFVGEIFMYLCKTGGQCDPK